MVQLLRKCLKCSRYSLKETCPVCGEQTKSPHPAKFSMDDHYLEYRLRMKRLAAQKSTK